jgi:hypothetical protein
MVMYTLTTVDIVGHVAEWLRRGLQRPYVNRVFPYKHCIIQQFRLQVFSVGHSWDIEIKILI